MRIVLDTNVLMSAIYFAGTPKKIFDATRGGRFRLVVSTEIMDEYRRVAWELAARYPADSQGPLDYVAAHGEFIDPPPIARGACRDPSDDKFIACAAAANALLVSGDKDLLAISGALGVEVLTPREFLDRLAG